VFRKVKDGEVPDPVRMPELSRQIAQSYDSTNPVRDILRFKWISEAWHRIGRDLRDGKAERRAHKARK